MFHKHVGTTVAAHHAGTAAAIHHTAHHIGTTAVTHHVAGHAGMGMWTMFKYRFIHSLVYTEVYRFFRKIGLLYSGQNVFVHALIIAIVGCLAYWLFHKIYKHFSNK